MGMLYELDEVERAVNEPPYAISEQRLVELEIHALDCDRGAAGCELCWELEREQ